MDITDLRIIATLATFVTFIGILVWVSLKRNKDNFDKAAHLPFEGEE